ncbi:DUF2628 domain-containing protein [Orbus wheelerorum]|uniref:DUF2628 domain-containing protein n=1 Tax=Orbus wheelerorum TaxID=3074111 RepID=UPI00370D6B06
MKNYKVFKHSDGRIEAVKQGWSWPGFLFGFIWALVKKLWLVAGVLVAIAIITGILVEVTAPDSYSYYESSSAIFPGLLAKLPALLTAIFLGIRGNFLREKDLINKGYELIGTTTSENPDMAINEVKKMELVILIFAFNLSIENRHINLAIFY